MLITTLLIALAVENAVHQNLLSQMHFCQTTRPITKFGTLTKDKS